jgi:hypothetical protein
MKILQFIPPPKPESQNQGRRPEAAGDFAALMKRFQNSDGPGGLISLENRLARQLPPDRELKEADRLLGRLDQAIRAAPPDALDRVHSLEGLICLYKK